ncbi:predicted protein [Sclerotinia sclerotiorum 1980 UF-70]|uniref:Uncharacterized protein n=1 Tax=Sclerotinia sclerotiorum (strain ATCC 18683 / 1980 / Ss-1) TaxID=665079 RepID=A7EB77_SCLS1|nr:predicted protein [Sclerotinia sclerotiorum 1980 UF-70]EDN99705.1 predicted protein [Sclerotinia sclerotiorum 1980 UF-70]
MASAIPRKKRDIKCWICMSYVWAMTADANFYAYARVIQGVSNISSTDYRRLYADVKDDLMMKE